MQWSYPYSKEEDQLLLQFALLFYVLASALLAHTFFQLEGNDLMTRGLLNQLNVNFSIPFQWPQLSIFWKPCEIFSLSSIFCNNFHKEYAVDYVSEGKLLL